jgi:hypothetical protein
MSFASVQPAAVEREACAEENAANTLARVMAPSGNR